MLSRVLFEPGALSRGVRDELSREFPTLALLEAPAGREPGDAAVDADAWTEPSLSFFDLDRRLDVLGGPSPKSLRIRGERASDRALSVLSRAQRLVLRRNDGGRHSGPLLRALEALHEAAGLDRPLVRADLDHAIDAWQWLIRIEPDASLPLQIACLFHDVERLESEAGARREQGAADYQAFKDAHAARGAEIVRASLSSSGLPAEWVEEAARLVARHERKSEETAALGDADALSFFSLNSPGYLDYFGPAQTGKKVAYTFARMRPAARERALSLCLRADVARIVAEVAEVAEVAQGARNARDASGRPGSHPERPAREGRP